MARCERRLPLVENDRPHSLHGKGRSPRCVAWCRRSAVGQLSTRRQTPHWLFVRPAAVPGGFNDGSMPLTMAFAPLFRIPRVAIISEVRLEREEVSREEDGFDATTYVAEVLAFDK